MVLHRIQSVISNKQSWYWLICIILFGAALNNIAELPLLWHRKIILNEQTIPGLVLAFALLTTTIWSYVFLLLPVHKMTDLFKDKPGCYYTFRVIFYFSLGLSFFLVLVYLEAMSRPELSSGAGVVHEAFADLPWPTFGRILHDFHLIVFIGLYTAMDAIVAFAALDDRIKARFANVVVFVDFPILFSMAFIDLLMRPMVGLSFYFFEAGVVAFQLIAGSFSVIALDTLQDTIENCSISP